MTSDPYRLRTATADEWPAVAAVLAEAFHDEFDDEALAVEGAVFEPDRTVLAVRDDAIAGVSSAFTRDMVVPGGTVPTAHVTMVSVGATHRRQGLLNRMIDHLHTAAAGLGEPVAALWASEARIYQRYGYGLAATRMSIEAKTGEATFREPAGPGEHRVRAVPADAVEEFRPVYERVVADRPGWTHRDDRWWKYVLADSKSSRAGHTARRAAVHDGPDGVDGYLIWRVKNDWAAGGPTSVANVRELVAATPEAYRALWRFAFSIDLTRVVRSTLLAVDEPLQYLVSDPRWLDMRLADSLWVRLLDVPTALAARRYAAPVDVVIEVTDDRIPANAGRWRLSGDRDTATCVSTGDPADLACDVHALGTAYLGGAPLAALAAGGALRELRAGALAPATAAFGWHRAPSATETF